MGLIGGMARTAVVAGTATAVSNRVARRQHGRWAADEALQQQQNQQYAPPPQQYAQPPQQYAPPPQQYEYAQPAASSSLSTDELIAKLQQLGQLRDSGVLTPAEFEAQKAKLLAG
ncbi:MAG TPA: SHOCT domain-containing protein [Micropruina sp.]|nr:SHOCT domain-containing protein [Micropruina sp.]